MTLKVGHVDLQLFETLNSWGGLLSRTDAANDSTLRNLHANPHSGTASNDVKLSFTSVTGVTEKIELFLKESVI